MSLNELLKDPWIVAAATFVVTVAFVPLVSTVVKRIRALFGPFSGQYLALTGEPRAGTVLVEDVRCRHRSHHLTGTIRGVAVLQRDRQSGGFEEVAENVGKYTFHGFVDERLFVISYRTKIPGVHSAGSIALKGESTGSVFRGRWAGLVHDTVDNAVCIWVKLDPPVSSKKRRNEFLARAVQCTLSPSGAPIKVRVVAKKGFGKGGLRHIPIDVISPRVKPRGAAEKGVGKAQFPNIVNHDIPNEESSRRTNREESAEEAERD